MDDQEELQQILENDEIEKLLIESCSKKDPQPVNKIKIVPVKKGQKGKKNEPKKEDKNENKKENKKKEKKEDKKEPPKKMPKPKPKPKKNESSDSSSSSGSDSESSEGGASSSGSGSSSSSSDSESGSSSDSDSSNIKNKKKINQKITIDKKTLEDFENQQDNNLIMILENEIKDQVSTPDEVQVLGLLNEALEYKSPEANNNNINPEDESPIPYQLGDDINDEKFYLYVYECIRKIKLTWNEYSKQYLKNIISKFRKTQNIFTYRRYLKEPFKTILTDFLLYIMTKNNLKEEDILKLAEPIIDKSWPVSVIVKDENGNPKEEKKEIHDDNENNQQFLGKKKKRKGTYEDYSSSSSSDSEEQKEEKKENNEEKKEEKMKKKKKVI